ncbi:MAG TPA: stage V sporulation protein AC [Clostridiales bacterium]|nr:MAG: stage V sporulation protein AC [Clostridiales bacterium GWD2_32_59]HAN09213.1 stage V sporulation protein AC [Clostridiales bacterium]
MDKAKQIKQNYKEMVERASPSSNMGVNCMWAFFVGGTICVIGQVITDVLKTYGYGKDDAAMITTVILIFIGALLTGLNLYDNIGKYAGAGSIVPITGFSNSVVAPAMEYKKEGYILGMGARMFTVAGPVIVYGVISSVAVGIIYYFFK